MGDGDGEVQCSGYKIGKPWRQKYSVRDTVSYAAVTQCDERLWLHITGSIA